jgi:hypothetical protein
MQGQAWFEHQSTPPPLPLKSSESSESEQVGHEKLTGSDAGGTIQVADLLEIASSFKVEEKTTGTSDETIVAPNEQADTTGDDRGRAASSTSTDESELKREACAERDNPLSAAQEGTWQRQFEDTELRDEIWKDVVRTHPGLHFFTDHTYEAMQRILFVYAKLNPGVRYVQVSTPVLKK